MKTKLDMQSLYACISCCATPFGVDPYLTFASGCWAMYHHIQSAVTVVAVDTYSVD